MFVQSIAVSQNFGTAHLAVETLSELIDASRNVLTS